MENGLSNQLSISRLSGISFGFATHLLFAFTVWHLFAFLYDSADTLTGDKWFLRDAALAILFAVTHSAMLFPVSRKQLTKVIPTAFYDCVFCVVTCLCLLTMFYYWQTSSALIWDLRGWSSVAVRIGFYGSWLALFYSLWLTGIGYQTGWTPFWYWLRREPAPRREFAPRGAYKIIRHPVYMSFLGLVWFTPRMTLDHAVLTGIWTAYIFYGSTLKDRRLVYYVGDTYRKYARQVPGYPMMPAGSLARWVPEPVTGVSIQQTKSSDLQRNNELVLLAVSKDIHKASV